MTLNEALKQALTEAATALAVPLFWEGTAYTPPLTPHLVARIDISDTLTAGLGKHAPQRTTGALMVDVATVSGNGDSDAQRLAADLARHFPRGRGLAIERGEVVCMTPTVAGFKGDGRRLAVPLKIPFYAMTEV